MKVSIRILGVAAGSLAGGLLIDAVLFAVFGNVWERQYDLADVLPALVAGNVLTAAALYFPVSRSTLNGIHLFVALFLAYFGLNVFLTQIEAIAFLQFTKYQLLFTSTQATLSALVVTLLAARFFDEPRAPGAASPLSVSGWTGRVAALTLAYITLYFAAGMSVYPFVQEYYEAQNFEVGPWLPPLQLARGALYVAFSITLVRSISASRWQTVLATAFMFPVISGVAALLVPNPFMPDFVRHWHMLEIAWSNFVFGGLVGYVFWGASRDK